MGLLILMFSLFFELNTSKLLTLLENAHGPDDQN